MATRNSKKRPSGSHEPKAIEAILGEMLRGDSRFAAAYRKYKQAVAEAEGETDQLFKEVFPHTELAVNLKLLTRKPGRMPVDAYLDGTLFREGEDRFYFIQDNAEKKQKVKRVRRTPVIYSGCCVNVHLLCDGTKRLEFTRPRFYSDFTFRDFCLTAAKELVKIARLFGEEGSQE